MTTLFEYRCPGCGSQIEVFRDVAERDDNAPMCACGGGLGYMNRVITAPAIRGETVSRPKN